METGGGGVRGIGHANRDRPAHIFLHSSGSVVDGGMLQVNIRVKGSCISVSSRCNGPLFAKSTSSYHHCKGQRAPVAASNARVQHSVRHMPRGCVWPSAP